MPKRGRSDDGSPSSSPSRPCSLVGSLGSSSPPSSSRTVRLDRMPSRGRRHDDAESATLVRSSPTRSCSHRRDRMPKRDRRDDAASPSKRRRRDSAPDSRGTPNWADLPADILEMIFVKLAGPALASAQVCYRWRISAMTFPLPVVLCPARSGRMELLVPTAVMPRDVHISESVAVAADGRRRRPFTYVILPALGSHPELRLIGGSSSVLLLIDDSHRRLVARRFVGPAEELRNALSETLLSIDLPEGVASHDIYCGIFAVDSSTTSFHLVEEIIKIKGLLLATQSSIFGILVEGSTASSHWSSVQIPLVARQKHRNFISAASFGGLTYFMDQTQRLVACSMDLFGIHTDEVPANIHGLLDQHIKVLKTWIMHLSLGEATNDSRLLCLRYEYNHPRCFRFAAYDLVVGEDRGWRVRRELKDFCIFIGWGPGAGAFAYWNPQRIGLARGAIYGARQGRSYCLRTPYRYNVMPPLESLTWPFAIWIKHSFSIPYVPLPRCEIMPEALPAPAGNGAAGDGADAADQYRCN